MTITAGKKVSMEYTLRLEDKTVIDTNVGGQPLSYTQGKEDIIPGLEKEMEGMNVGDSKEVTVTPEEGYGVVNQEAFIEVNKTQIPEQALQVGAQIQGQTQEGQPLQGLVAEIKDDTVILDFNHPLAGKTLYFDVKILGID